MKPGQIVLLETEIAAEEKERSRYGAQGWKFNIFATFSHLDCLGEQPLSPRKIRTGVTLVFAVHIRSQLHVWLYEHVCTKRGHQTPRLDGFVHDGYGILQTIPVKNRLCRIEVVEKEIDATVYEAGRETLRAA